MGRFGQLLIWYEEGSSVVDWLHFEMAKFTMQERIREADHARLVAEARRGRRRQRLPIRSWRSRRNPARAVPGTA